MLLPLLVLFLAYTNLFWLVLFLALVTGCALSEFYRMSLSPERYGERIAGAFVGSLLLLVATLGPASSLGVGLVVCSLGFASWYLFRFRHLDTVCRDLAFSLLGLLYLPSLLAQVASLFQLPDGRRWIFLVLLVVMAADSAAYFVGSKLGRRKLYPQISPNKSWEGSIGGVAGSLVGALLAKVSFFPGLSAMDVLFVGVLLSVSGQVGDLFESMLKRSFGVKDSGSAIPGHGGLLDRLDSLLFAFPVAYGYALFC